MAVYDNYLDLNQVGPYTGSIPTVVVPDQPPMQAAMQPQTPVAQAMQPQAQTSSNQMPPLSFEGPGGQLKQGVFSKLFNDSATGVSPIEYIFRGLGAAGSQDPIKVMQQYAQLDADNMKQREAIRKVNQPQTKHIAGAAFGVYGPDGQLIRTFVDPVLGKYEEQKALQAAGLANDKAVQQALLQEAIRKGMDTFKGVTEAAGGAAAKPEFSSEVQRKIDNIGGLIPKIEGIDTLPGGFKNPAIANVIDQTWGRVAGSPDYESRRKLDAYLKEGVMTDIKTLGSNPSEGDRRFMEKKVPAQDDPTSYKIEYLTELRQRIQESENRRVAAAQQRDTMATTSSIKPTAAAQTPQTQPAPQTDLSAAAKAAGIPYEPQKYEYRIGPNGQLQRKPKG